MTLRGKPRWSIVRGDWRLVQLRRGDNPVAFEGELPPGYADAKVVDTGRWGLRVSDGSWRLFGTKTEAEAYRRRQRHRGAAHHGWAEASEAKVRLALKRARGGMRIKVGTITDNVLSSYLEPGKSIFSAKHDPFIVYVFTESGNLRDPMEHPRVRDMFDRAVESLEADPWIAEAGWESYNAAVQYFWLKPVMES